MFFSDRPMMSGFQELRDEDRLSQRVSQLSIKTEEEPLAAIAAMEGNMGIIDRDEGAAASKKTFPGVSLSQCH